MSEAKVTGYRTLSDKDISSMNRLKEISRQFIAQVEFLNDGDVDHRCMAIARTKMQEACMWACRGVAQPKDDC